MILKMPVTYEIKRERGFIETCCMGKLTFLPENVQLLEVTRAVDRLKTKVKWDACTIAARRDALFGMSHMVEAYTEGLFTRICVFRGRKDAQRWFACFLALLVPLLAPKMRF
jgi:hypothetical protein